jgi:23S rRNA (uracil1939-C5)-methyltransferase
VEGGTSTEAARTRAPRRGERLEVEIDSLAFGGRGVARADGFVVFVAGGLPGDRVLAEVTKGKKRFAEARTVELLRAGADRLPDRCVHGGEPCPGAPWQGLAYERQLTEKQTQVEDSLRRIGGLDDFEMEPIVGAAEEWRYRNKLEYSFGAGAVGTADEGVALGFHARGRWDLIVDVDDCKLASEPGNAARNGVREWARMEDVSAYDAAARKGVLRNLVVREGRRTGQIQTRLVTTAARLPRPPVDLHTTIEGDSGGTDGPTGALGEERLHEELCGLKFEMSHGAFFQTNTEMAERLYGVATEFAGLTGRERVFDLFCGIGTIGLTMAREAGEVWGLEIVPEAIDDAERNAKRNGIENAKFMAGNARTGVRPLVEKAGKPDVVIVDPPRAGLSQKIVRRLIECEAQKIVYVSCNPTTLAPNAAQLEEAGYKLRRVRPVDMFPQTPHIECVALFEKTRPTPSAPEPEETEAAEPSLGVAAAEGTAAADSGA